MVTWDYVIIGAGSSGCAVANEVSASADKRVLVLEAGGSDRSIRISFPMAVAFTDMKSFDWGYRCVADPTRNSKAEAWPRGRVLGGTSSINGMNYVRGSALDFDRWAAMGNAGWDGRSVLPLFRELERCDGSIPASQVRGREGLLHVRMIKKRHPVTEAFVKAAQAAGYRFTPDYNGLVQEGIGYAQSNQRSRRRWSAADAFLRPVLGRRNIELALNAHVHKLVIRQRKVVAVRYEQGGRIREARAGKVIVCAGAINTPQLLMLSGVGDAIVLRDHGIEVVLDRKGVGRNLMEHPLIRLIYRTRRPTYSLTEGPHQKLRYLAEYLLHGQGPLSCPFESIGFLRTSSEEPEPDVQLHVAAFGFGEERAKGTVKLMSYPSMTVVVNKNHPISRGRVSLAGADPKTAPLIEPTLLESAEDVRTLVQGIRMVRRIVAAAPFADWLSEETLPGGECNSAESLEQHVRAHTEIAYHPAGTCRMGIDNEAIVTPDLEVRGIENLWIADASIMPDLISGNTNAACMMIGMKLGKSLVQRTW